MGVVEPLDKTAQAQMKGPSSAAATGSMYALAPRPCRFRVKHSSGETVCVDLETARALQRQMPGAKIFREQPG